MGSTAHSVEGALYELVARGNKDVYFIEDSKTAKNLFDNRYGPFPAHIHERRKLPPLNAPDFGRSFEFQVEMAGDLFTEPTLLIDLPSWLPPQQAAQNPKALCTDLSGISYGYVNGIGYFLFERIQLLQDNILLQEFSGDALWAVSRGRGSLNSAFLDNALTGIHGGSALEIQRNATPGQLRLTLPLFGCQHIDDGGFPAVCTPHQSYRIRCFLRKLEDLVETSNGSPKPQPWTTTFKIKTSANGDFSEFKGLERQNIAAPNIMLETRHVYVEDDTKKAIVDARLEIPFERLYESIFTQDGWDYAPLAKGATAAITRRLEGVHPASSIISFFRSYNALQANQLWNISNDVSGNQFYQNLKLTIAGRDRESLFSPLVWNNLVTHAKLERDTGLPFAIMDWTRGDIRGRRSPYARQPDGTINMTTADRPDLYIELQDIVIGQKKSELRAIVVSWACMLIEKYRATLLFGN